MGSGGEEPWRTLWHWLGGCGVMTPRVLCWQSGNDAYLHSATLFYSHKPKLPALCLPGLAKSLNTGSSASSLFGAVSPNLPVLSKHPPHRVLTVPAARGALPRLC